MICLDIAVSRISFHKKSCVKFQAQNAHSHKCWQTNIAVHYSSVGSSQGKSDIIAGAASFHSHTHARSRARTHSHKRLWASDLVKWHQASDPIKRLWASDLVKGLWAYDLVKWLRASDLVKQTPGQTALGV